MKNYVWAYYRNFKIIDGLKTMETYYEPVDTGIWEEIDFFINEIVSCNNGISATQADVEVCPRFPQVEK